MKSISRFKPLIVSILLSLCISTPLYLFYNQELAITILMASCFMGIIISAAENSTQIENAFSWITGILFCALIIGLIVYFTDLKIIIIPLFQPAIGVAVGYVIGFLAKQTA